MTTATTPPATADTQPAPDATVPVKTETTPARRPAPFDMLETLQEEMARLWSQGWPLTFAPLGRCLARTVPELAMWTPRIDVFEQGTDFVVKADLPGANKADISVTLEQGDLIIRGERKAESEVKEEHYYRMERSTGGFYRRVPLPFETTAEAVQASYTGGILEIRVPKPAAEARPAAQTIMVI